LARDLLCLAVALDFSTVGTSIAVRMPTIATTMRSSAKVKARLEEKECMEGKLSFTDKRSWLDDIFTDDHWQLEAIAKSGRKSTFPPVSGSPVSRGSLSE